MIAATMGPVIAFAAPLGTDSAAVCTALAARERIVMRRRLIIAATLTTFEAVTPALGMMASGPVGSLMGEWSAYLAGALLIGLGVWMLAHRDDGSDAPELGSAAGMLSLLAVGFAVSVDEIAVGVSLGMAGVPVVPLVATVAVWVFAATMTGLSLGSRVPDRFQAHAARVAAVALIGLGVAVATGIL